jgi:hypothetical protein
MQYSKTHDLPLGRSLRNERGDGSATIAVLLIRRVASDEAVWIALAHFDWNVLSQNRSCVILEDLAATTELCLPASMSCGLVSWAYLTLSAGHF